MTDFRPHPLFPTGHLQTLAGIYLPRRVHNAQNLSS